jgi:hypothetical protein
MTTADEVLNQIDAAIADHTVSADAMRSQPSPSEPPSRGARMWIAPAATAPDSEGWQEVGFIDGSLDIDQATIDPDALRTETTASWQEVVEWAARTEAERARRAREALAAITAAFQALRPALERAARSAAAAMEQLKQAGVRDDHGKPVRVRDRPAWQSPYGPARRRRR